MGHIPKDYLSLGNFAQQLGISNERLLALHRINPQQLPFKFFPSSKINEKLRVFHWINPQQLLSDVEKIIEGTYIQDGFTYITREDILNCLAIAAVDAEAYRTANPPPVRPDPSGALAVPSRGRPLIYDLIQAAEQYSYIHNLAQDGAEQDKPQVSGEADTSTPQIAQKPKKKNRGHGAITAKIAANILGVSERTIRTWESDHKKAPKGYPGRDNKTAFHIFSNAYKQEKLIEKQARAMNSAASGGVNPDSYSDHEDET